jgi:hypothetical protein
MTEIERLYQILLRNIQRLKRFCPVWDLNSHAAALGGSGIYFIFERGELRTNSPQERVVRVGIEVDPIFETTIGRF